jgi:hypothetical protein
MRVIQQNTAMARLLLPGCYRRPFEHDIPKVRQEHRFAPEVRDTNRLGLLSAAAPVIDGKYDRSEICAIVFNCSAVRPTANAKPADPINHLQTVKGPLVFNVSSYASLKDALSTAPFSEGSCLSCASVPGFFSMVRLFSVMMSICSRFSTLAKLVSGSRSRDRI